MTRNIAVGLDIGSHSVQALVAEKKENEASLQILGFGLSPSRGLRKGEIANEQELALSIKEALAKAGKTSGIKIEEVYAGVSGETLKSFRTKGMAAVSKADGEITDFDIARAVETAKNNLGQILNREIIHVAPVGFKIDDDIQTQNPLGLKGMRLEADVLFVTSLNQHLKKLVRTVEAAGFSVVRPVADPIAGAKAAVDNNQKEVGVLLLDIGGSNASVAVFENNTPISLEIFPIGSAHITNDIAIGFQISLNEAEDLKLNYQDKNLGREQKKQLDEIIEARLGDVFELVDKHLRKMGKNNLLPAGVVLTGGGANLANLAAYAKKNLRLPAEKASFENRIRANQEFLYRPEWGTVLGLCLVGLEEESENSWVAGKSVQSFILRWLQKLLP